MKIKIDAITAKRKANELQQCVDDAAKKKLQGTTLQKYYSETKEIMIKISGKTVVNKSQDGSVQRSALKKSLLVALVADLRNGPSKGKKARPFTIGSCRFLGTMRNFCFLMISLR